MESPSANRSARSSPSQLSRVDPFTSEVKLEDPLFWDHPIAEIFKITPLPIYQSIALKVKHLLELGMICRAIAHELGVSDKTAAKAAAWPDLTLYT